MVAVAAVGKPPAGAPRAMLQPPRAAADGATGETVQIVEIQRSRLLAAAVHTIDELGYAGATVAHVTRRARVSRRTFYELFDGREECLLALIDDTVARLRREIAGTEPQALPWRERVRTGLWMILGFFDRQPALARVCFVEAPRSGPRVIARREEILATLAAVIDEGCHESARAAQRPPLTAEGLVGASFTILHSRLLRDYHEPLVGLLGTLMATIVLPYLGGAAARAEQARPAPAPRDERSQASSGESPQEDLLAGLAMRMTYRTAKVLRCVEERPGASNRQIAERAGIHDPGQISKLLTRLQRLGLLANRSSGHVKGEPNAWTLTADGRRLVRGIHHGLAEGPTGEHLAKLEKGRR